ncbi:MAG: c-type cytochrome domain-containing protein, partial [bacterium]
DYRPFTESIDRKARRPFTVASSEPIFVQVSSILETNCVKCHGPEKQRSGYRLDRLKEALQGGEIADFRETSAIIPGDSTQGLLLQFVQAKEEDPDNEIYPMPPGKNPRLAEAEIEMLRAWIEQGAPWPEGHQLRLPPQQTRP